MRQPPTLALTLAALGSAALKPERALAQTVLAPIGITSEPPPAPGAPAPLPSRAPIRALRMDVTPYPGGPVPAGARVESRLNMPALEVGGGIVLFSYGPLAYLAFITGLSNATLAAASGGGYRGIYPTVTQWFWLPIAGPFIVVGLTPEMPTWLATLLVLDGLTQLGGAVVAAVGLATPRRVLVREHYELVRRAPRWIVTPGAPGAVAGATLTAWHF